MDKLTEDLKRRVLAAYFRASDKCDYENVHEVRGIELKGLIYFYLITDYGRVQACFRYVEQRDVLKRIKRLPKELKEFA